MSDHELCPYCSDENCVNNACQGLEACDRETLPLDNNTLSRDVSLGSLELPLNILRMEYKQKMGTRENSGLGTSHSNMMRMMSSNGDVDINMEPMMKMKLGSTYYK